MNLIPKAPRNHHDGSSLVDAPSPDRGDRGNRLAEMAPLVPINESSPGGDYGNSSKFNNTMNGGFE